MEQDLQSRIKKIESKEEMMALLKENGVDIGEKDAAAYFKAINKRGEISDDELDDVSGGACYSEEVYLMVTCGYSCSYFQRSVASESNRPKCSACMYWDKPWGDTGTEIGTWFGLPLRCVHPANRK